MILIFPPPPLGQIDIEALVEVQLVEVVHVHVAAVDQHLDKLPAPHVIDHGVKLHFQPHAI